MKENKYDNHDFFDQYSRMQRPGQGLQGANERFLTTTGINDNIS